jgi:hypothetical protein
MKKYACVVAFILLALPGCRSREEMVTPAQLPGTWQFSSSEVIAWGAQSGQPLVLTPEDMGYDLFYEFFPDSTFVKRLSTGVRTAGTYSVQYTDGAYRVALRYREETGEAEQVLQSSCSYYGEFALELAGPDQLIEDDQGCDGPKWIFRKVE